MGTQISRRVERLAAEIARIQQLPGVNSHVFLQSQRSFESLLANRTPMSPLQRVLISDMLLQSVIVWRLLAAKFALDHHRFLLMPNHVLPQRIFVFHPLFADRTLYPGRVEVLRTVYQEGTFTLQHLGTDVAHDFVQPVVYASNVKLQLPVGGEPLLALGTLEFFPFLVLNHVSVQLVLLGELFGAGFTLERLDLVGQMDRQLVPG